jgi:hypothetical protein
MTKETAIKLFETKQVRTAWNEDTEEWYFSVVDTIEVLTENTRPRKYWDDLKRKLRAEGSELSEKIGQLKMLAPDGKMRFDCLNLDFNKINKINKIFLYDYYDHRRTG